MLVGGRKEEANSGKFTPPPKPLLTESQTCKAYDGQSLIYNVKTQWKYIDTDQTLYQNLSASLNQEEF